MEYQVQSLLSDVVGDIKIKEECVDLDESGDPLMSDFVETELNRRAYCSKCNKTIVKRHQRDHEKICGTMLDKIHRCPFDGCEQVFAISGYLATHISRVHKDPKVNCPYEGCPTVCKKYRLLQHIKDIHHGQKRVYHKIKCETCGKSVINIWGHRARCMARLLEERSFECNYENCKATFKTDGARQGHINSVHKSPVKCPIINCNSVIKPISMARHIRTVHKKSN